MHVVPRGLQGHIRTAPRESKRPKRVMHFLLFWQNDEKHLHFYASKCLDSVQNIITTIVVLLKSKTLYCISLYFIDISSVTIFHLKA